MLKKPTYRSAEKMFAAVFLMRATLQCPNTYIFVYSLDENANFQ